MVIINNIIYITIACRLSYINIKEDYKELEKR